MPRYVGFVYTYPDHCRRGPGEVISSLQTSRLFSPSFINAIKLLLMTTATSFLYPPHNQVRVTSDSDLRSFRHLPESAVKQDLLKPLTSVTAPVFHEMR